MHLPTQDKALFLLKKYSSDERSYQKILSHAQAVQKVALRIAARIPNVNQELIKIGSLLHDIGRFRCPPGDMSILHGIKGAEILISEGYKSLAKIAERHLGAGISKTQIEKHNLPLPKKDYLPRSKEEKIITHADNLIFGDREGTMQEVIDRYTKELGTEYAERVKALADEVKSWMTL